MMRNKKIIFGGITLLMVMCLTGCGGSDSSSSNNPVATGTSSGVAVDPYIEGAVFQEIAADGATVLQRESTPSDAQGRFTFFKPLTEGSLVELKISRKGMHQGAPFEGMLKRKFSGTRGGAVIVSPLTTLLANGVSEDEIIAVLATSGLSLTVEELYNDPMLGVENQSGQIDDNQLKPLHANMAVNHFMTTIDRFDIKSADLDNFANIQLLSALVKANQDLLNGAEFTRINSALNNSVNHNDPLVLGDLLTSVVQTMRVVVAQAKEQHLNGTLDPNNIGQEVNTALQSAVQDVLALYLTRVGEVPPTTGVDGAQVFVNECGACHNLGSGGLMDLSAKGVLVIEKIAAQHQGKVLSADQLQALVAHVDAVTAPPVPDPAPLPDGQTLYDTHCAGCHKLGEYDLNGSAPELAGTESIISGKINAGHRSISLSTADVAALVDWVALNSVVPVPTPDPTPDPLPDGIALYESECQGCHGPLNNNNVQNRSSAGIQQAIDSNLGGMGMLTLSPEEVQAIADSFPILVPTPDPTPDPTPTPVDGQTLYDNSCAGCHLLGDYDVAGFAPELGGLGNLVISKLEAGHQSISLTADELNALATWANANPAPTPIPDPTPVPVDGQALYDGQCAGCHILGDYDSAGFAPELGGQGTLVISKLEAGHQAIILTVDELNALADWADAHPAPTPIPDPTPVPVNGQSLYDSNCAGCHSVNEYDVTGSAPDLASTGTQIAPKLAAGHNGFVLTTEEEIALADFLDLYQAPVTGPDYSDCTACHAQPPNGSSFPNGAGSHTVHSALPGIGADCNVCHSGAGHNDVLEVAFATNFDAKSGVATANADGTCSTVSCHGGQTTPDWFTGSLSVNTQCSSCHIRSTGEYNGYYSGKHDFHVVKKGYDCTVCHNTTKLAAGHFSNLSSSGFELSPANTIGGGSTQVGSYSSGTCSSVQCHGSDKW